MRPDPRLAPASAVPGVQPVPFATALAQAPRLVVRQSRNLLEVFTPIEQRNRYAVFTEDGAFVAGFAEHGEGAGAFFARWVLQSRRPFTMGLYPSEHPSQPLLLLDRPWRWWMSRLEVREAATGRLLGAAQQRFSLFRKRIDLEGPDGRPLARLTGPLLRPWTVLVEQGPESNPREVGRIEKKWSGFLKEAFTDADTFLVTLPARDASLRALLLAAAVLVDFLWFERRD
jgi:hypothetical protein